MLWPPTPSPGAGRSRVASSLAALVDEEGMMTRRQGPRRPRADGRRRRRHLLRARGRRDLPRGEGRPAAALELTGKMAHGAMPFQGRNPNRAPSARRSARSPSWRPRVQAAPRRGPVPRPGVDDPDRAARRRARPDERHAGHSPRCGSTCARSPPSTTRHCSPSWPTSSRRPSTTLGIRRRRRGDRRPSERARPPRTTPSCVPSGRPTRPSPGPPPASAACPARPTRTIISSRTGIPSVVYGPGGKWIAHQADEFVEVADLVAHAEVYVEAADRFLRRAS